MPRIVITVSKKMDQGLREYSEKTNAPVAALVREAIEEWGRQRGLEFRGKVSWGSPHKIEDEDEQGQLVPVLAR